jgi:serine protease inhibitor
MSTLALANRNFACALYSALAQECEESFIFSPLPFSIAFSLLLNGADPETQKELRALTSLNGMSLDEINQQNLLLQKILSQLDSSGETFVLANSLWVSLPLEFSPAFLQAADRYYRTEVVSALRAELPARISQWAREKTRGKVDMQLGETDSALLSATYFKGKWTCPFDERNTAPLDFHPEKGRAHPVPMMSQRGEYGYFQGNTFQAVTLPFSAATMHFVLPHSGFLRNNTIYAIEKEVLRDGWIFTQPFANLPGLVKVPKFKIHYEGKFVRILEGLGVKRLFSSFDSLRPAVTHPDGARVENVLQNSFIAVDEKGAEAASVLAMPMAFGAALGWKPPKPFEFIADRPFCFWLTENHTGSILFMGRLTDVQP